MRSASKPPETTIRTSPKPLASSCSRTSRTSSGATPFGACSPCTRWSERSASRSDVSSRTPHSAGPSARATAERGADGVVGEVDQHGDVHVVRVAPRERRRGGDRVAAVGRDQPVRDGADAAAAPPRGLRVGRDADRAGHVRRPAVAGLHEPVVVARREEQDRLAAGGLDHLGDVAHDQRAAREAAEVDGLEVREQRRTGPRSSSRSPTARSRRPRAARAPRARPSRPPSRRPRAGAPSTARAPRRPRRYRRGRSACAGTPASSRAGCGPRARAAPWCS